MRGLGAAHHGSGHWLLQRLTALGNVLLVTWFVVSLLRLPLGDHGAVIRWASNPTVAFALMLLRSVQNFVKDLTGKKSVREEAAESGPPGV